MPEYWIIQPETGVIEIFSSPVAGRYQIIRQQGLDVALRFGECELLLGTLLPGSE